MRLSKCTGLEDLRAMSNDPLNTEPVFWYIEHGAVCSVDEVNVDITVADDYSAFEWHEEVLQTGWKDLTAGPDHVWHNSDLFSNRQEAEEALARASTAIRKRQGDKG